MSTIVHDPPGPQAFPAPAPPRPPARDALPSGAPAALDALLPPAMALEVESLGVRKAAMHTSSVAALGVLGGAFIALGAMFTTTILAGGAALPYGVQQLLAGLVFSLGLMLVVVGGAELFTGNTMLTMAWAGRKITARRLLANWSLVYVTNFVGAAATALLVFLSAQYGNGGGAVGEAALAIASRKVQLGFVQAVAAGMLCNALVCLGVWLSFSARTTIDRMAAVLLPVAAFVAAGFEHSVANMYFLPVALLIKGWAPAGFWQQIGRTPADYAHLGWEQFLVGNLLPVTIGNIIGGGVMVAGVYWFVYLRRRGAVAVR